MTRTKAPTIVDVFAELREAAQGAVDDVDAIEYVRGMRGYKREEELANLRTLAVLMAQEITALRKAVCEAYEELSGGPTFSDPRVNYGSTTPVSPSWQSCGKRTNVSGRSFSRA